MPAGIANLFSHARLLTKPPLATLSVCLILTAISAAQAPSTLITPVTGESWLTHLQRPLNDTSMGKTGELGPPPPVDEDGSSPWLVTLSQREPGGTVAITGADLYRFNCRGCHGEQGLGAPPEIHSVINPMRATSATLVVERMKSTGMDISHAQAAQMAAQAKGAITERLQKGGENMPPFNYLREPETRALTGYLEQLADMPGTHAGTVQEAQLRVGELIAKSTCHICHDAAGVNPTPQQILQGAIPPLSTLTSRTNEAQFIRKVTHGWPIRMGDPAMLQRGRMPVFYYLTEDEAGAVYRYLTLYRPGSGQGSAVSTAQSQALLTLVSATDSVPAATRPVTEDVDSKSVVLMIALGAIVVMLIVGGFAITVREFRRLCSEAEKPDKQAEESSARAASAYSD